MNAVPHSRPWIIEDDLAAVRQTLASGMIGQGGVTAEFEARISDWVGGAGAVAVASGSAALVLALQALECGPGDEVVLPTYVCRHVLEAVTSVGSTGVFSDVRDDGLVDQAQLLAAITKQTRAVIVPHLYGMFVDLTPLRNFGVPIIEDCAQAVGDRRRPRIQGTLAVFSFHPTKCLTTGEGGMVVAIEPDQVARLREIRDGAPRADRMRLFSPLADTAAALGLSQLKRYPEFLRRRRAIADQYNALFEKGNFEATAWPSDAPRMHFRYPLRHGGAFDQLAIRFAERGVIVRRGVDELLHRLRGLPDTAFPNATRLFENTLSLPIHPSMNDSEISRCTGACITALSKL